MSIENEMKMLFEINGIEYECNVFFDYSAPYAGDNGRWGKEGRISWGSPEEPEEYTINRVIFDEILKDNKGKVTSCKEYDFSWILNNKVMVENIEEYLKDEREYVNE